MTCSHSAATRSPWRPGNVDACPGSALRSGVPGARWLAPLASPRPGTPTAAADQSPARPQLGMRGRVGQRCGIARDPVIWRCQACGANKHRGASHRWTAPSRPETGASSERLSPALNPAESSRDARDAPNFLISPPVAGRALAACVSQPPRTPRNESGFAHGPDF